LWNGLLDKAFLQLSKVIVGIADGLTVGLVGRNVGAVEGDEVGFVDGAKVDEVSGEGRGG